MLEITPAISLAQGIEAAFRQCIVHLEVAIRERLAGWVCSPITSDLVDLVLLVPEEVAETVSVPADGG